MIVIYDGDRPITAAERIITAKKEPETLAQIVTQHENGARQQYNVREILELANYLLACHYSLTDTPFSLRYFLTSSISSSL